MLHIEYQLTEQEFLDYNFYTGWQMPEKKAARIRYYLTVPGGFFIGILAILYLFDQGKLQTSSFIIAVIGFLFLVLMVRFRMRSIFNKQARKMIEQSGPETVLTKTELVFGEKGISGRTKVAEVKYSWDAFKKKIRVNDCYYLYTNIRQAIVIPCRAFASSKEIEEFEKILLTYFPLQAELDNLKK